MMPKRSVARDREAIFSAIILPRTRQASHLHQSPYGTAQQSIFCWRRLPVQPRGIFQAVRALRQCHHNCVSVQEESVSRPARRLLQTLCHAELQVFGKLQTRRRNNLRAQPRVPLGQCCFLLRSIQSRALNDEARLLTPPGSQIQGGTMLRHQRLRPSTLEECQYWYEQASRQSPAHLLQLGSKA